MFPSVSYMARNLRHVRLDPATYGADPSTYGTDYADIPPPTPTPDDAEYEDFQHQLSTSSLNLTATAQRPPSQYKNSSANTRASRKNLKQIGLNFLNAWQHLALALCRDVVLIPPLFHCYRVTRYGLETLHHDPLVEVSYTSLLTAASPTEYFLAGIWCLVAAYLSYQVIDGLMVRWIVTYQTSAAILRVLSMSMFLITIEVAALSIFSPEGSYSLHTWIFVSCVLTGAYIAQNFVTSNLDKPGNRRRTIDYYNIAVFAVVPVGFASFVSMMVLLRMLLIIRLDLLGGGSESVVGLLSTSQR